MTDAFTSLPEEFAGPLTMAQERLGIFAHRVLWYVEVGSTNDIRIHKIGDAVHGKAPIYQSRE